MLLCEDTPTPTTKPRDLTADAAIALFAEKWPLCFAVYERRRRPLKIGIRDEILSALDGAITPAELGGALRHYVNNQYYLRMVFAGAPRIGLDGNPCGAVTTEQAAAAAAKLAAYAAARRRRMAAAPTAERMPAFTSTPPALAPPDPEPAAPRRISLADLRQAAQLRKAREAAIERASV